MAPRRHDDLFDAIASFPALHAAARRAIRGKRAKPGAAAFMANRETELLRLERTLRDGTWRPGRYVEIEVFDPKHRIVSAAPFRDRVVHHALCAVVEPIFERGFIFDSYANRRGKGAHRAIERYEQYRDRHAHVLRCDVFRYFPAIDHAILKADLRRRIACERTLWLLDAIVDGSNPQEPVHLHYPGDTLFTPWERRRGLPIGNLTSQFFANLHLDGLDHFCREVLRAPYLRYVDDFALFADDPEVLDAWRERISGYLARRRLSLHPRKTVVLPTSEPADFLGLTLLPGGRRRLPEDNVRRFRNRLRGMRDRYHAGTLDFDDAHRRIQSWSAHADHADTWRLRDGSWNNNLRNLRSANRNNIGFRVASTPHGLSCLRHGGGGRAGVCPGPVMISGLSFLGEGGNGACFGSQGRRASLSLISITPPRCTPPSLPPRWRVCRRPSGSIQRRPARREPLKWL